MFRPSRYVIEILIIKIVMQIILLSGGSGKRLWPLSNEARSKQFIRLLPAPGGGRESMVQRVVRQLRESGIGAEVTVATSASQKDVILNQLGGDVAVVTEPQRRDTFPAIALSASWLFSRKGCGTDETVVVMACDPFTEAGFFETVGRIGMAVDAGAADLVLMGVRPTYASSKFGYIVPVPGDGRIYKVSRFTEKPDVGTAAELIREGALWNACVFGFRLGYMIDILRRYVPDASFDSVRERYGELPRISFDYEVAEKAENVAVVPFGGKWKDLGTWNALTEELEDSAVGNVIVDSESENTHVVNELEMPVMCLGAKDLVVVASYDGILVSDKARSEDIRSYADSMHRRPMYEEMSWGEYRVVDLVSLPDGYETLTRQVIVREGQGISCRAHRRRDEVWTFIDGEGRVVVDGVERSVGRGDSLRILSGTMHSVSAVTDLSFIEIQSGFGLSEDDVVFPGGGK